MTSKKPHSSGQSSKKNGKNRALAFLKRGDAEFRKSGLYQSLTKESEPSLSLEDVWRISSKIPGSVAADVVADRKKGRG